MSRRHAFVSVDAGALVVGDHSYGDVEDVIKPVKGACCFGIPLEADDTVDPAKVAAAVEEALDCIVQGILGCVNGS